MERRNGRPPFFLKNKISMAEANPSTLSNRKHRKGSQKDRPAKIVVSEEPVPREVTPAEECLGGSAKPRAPSLDEGTDAPLLDRTDQAADAGSGSDNRWSVVQKKAWKSWVTVLDWLPNKVVSNKFFVPVIPTKCRSRILDWQEASVLPYSKEDPTHPPLLSRLWDLLVVLQPPTIPSETTIDRGTLITPNWKRFGFQGIDPATDFRGGGVLGLRNMLYLAELYPGLTREMLQEEYPFAITCINATMSLMHLARITKGKKTCLETSQPNACFTSCTAHYRFSMGLGGGDLFSTPLAPDHGASTVCFFAAAAGEISSPRMPELPKVFIGAIPPGNSANEILQMAGVVFSEVFVIACACIHMEWLNSKRNIMEFNGIIKAGIVRLEQWLRDARDMSSFYRNLPEEWRN